MNSACREYTCPGLQQMFSGCVRDGWVMKWYGEGLRDHFSCQVGNTGKMESQSHSCHQRCWGWAPDIAEDSPEICLLQSLHTLPAQVGRSGHPCFPKAWVCLPKCETDAKIYVMNVASLSESHDCFLFIYAATSVSINNKNCHKMQSLFF